MATSLESIGIGLADAVWGPIGDAQRGLDASARTAHRASLRTERRRRIDAAPTCAIFTGSRDHVIADLEAALAAAGWTQNARDPQVVFIDGRRGAGSPATVHGTAHRVLLVGWDDDPAATIAAGAADDVLYLDDPRDLRIRLELAARAVEARRRFEVSLADARRLAEADPLTGLGNRRAMDRTIDVAIRGARRGTPGGLLLIDVDHFKRYNDRYGHLSGDVVLRRLGDAIAASLRTETDGAFRYGGEEFLVVVTQAEPIDVGRVAERIRAAVAALGIDHADHPAGHVTISVGVVALPAGVDTDALRAVDLADRALYAAKRDGRDRVRLAGAENAAAVLAAPSAVGADGARASVAGGRGTNAALEGDARVGDVTVHADARRDRADSAPALDPGATRHGGGAMSLGRIFQRTVARTAGSSPVREAAAAVATLVLIMACASSTVAAAAASPVSAPAVPVAPHVRASARGPAWTCTVSEVATWAREAK